MQSYIKDYPRIQEEIRRFCIAVNDGSLTPAQARIKFPKIQVIDVDPETSEVTIKYAHPDINFMFHVTLVQDRERHGEILYRGVSDSKNIPQEELDMIEMLANTKVND